MLILGCVIEKNMASSSRHTMFASDNFSLGSGTGATVQKIHISLRQLHHYPLHWFTQGGEMTPHMIVHAHGLWQLGKCLGQELDKHVTRCVSPQHVRLLAGDGAGFHRRSEERRVGKECR